MERDPERYKPTRKAASGTGRAVTGFVLFLFFLGTVQGRLDVATPLVLLGGLLGVVAFAVARAALGFGEPDPIRGRELRIDRGRLTQLDRGAAIACIDTTRPFEYRILDGHKLSDTLFRLYQDDGTLTFYNSDPGGGDVVRDVLQLEWPPRSRGASRTMGPPYP